MPGQRLRLHQSLAAIGLDDTQNHIVVSIPVGAEITVVNDDRNRAPWVKVSWSGRDWEMFAIDLQNRSALCAP
jgi:hypothetical protein